MKQIVFWSVIFVFGVSVLGFKTQYPSYPEMVAKNPPPASTWTEGPLKIDESTLRAEKTVSESVWTPQPPQTVRPDFTEFQAQKKQTKKIEIKKIVPKKIEVVESKPKFEKGKHLKNLVSLLKGKLDQKRSKSRCNSLFGRRA